VGANIGAGLERIFCVGKKKTWSPIKEKKILTLSESEKEPCGLGKTANDQDRRMSLRRKGRETPREDRRLHRGRKEKEKKEKIAETIEPSGARF